MEGGGGGVGEGARAKRSARVVMSRFARYVTSRRDATRRDATRPTDRHRPTDRPTAAARVGGVGVEWRGGGGG